MPVALGELAARLVASHAPAALESWQEISLQQPDEPVVVIVQPMLLELARKLGARSLELRAATSLAREWGATGRRHAARELLSSVYGWFEEGLRSPDAQRARELLAELGADCAS